MRSRVVWLGCVVACSNPAPRVAAPVAARAEPPPADVKTRSAVPALVVADREPGFAFEDPQRRAKLAAALPAIEKAIGEEMQAQALPGLAFGIVIDGELAYAKGFGVTTPGGDKAPDADTVYRIGSITKSFTGLAALALRDAGAISLDEPLARWIPEATELVYPTRDATPITLRQLANHTSGLPRMGAFEPETGPSEAVIISSLPKLRLETTPGTMWQYSNLGFSLLGIALGRAAKAPFHDVVATHILKPLGMTATVWDHDAVARDRLAPPMMASPNGPTPRPDPPSRLGAADGAGGIYSSVRDMAKYVAFQLAAYPPRNAPDTSTLRRATVRESHATGVPAMFKHTPPATAMSYGNGWSRVESCELDDSVGHGGGIDSYRSEIRFWPSRGVGMIALTNFGNGRADVFVDRAVAELGKTGAFAPRVPAPSPALVTALGRLLGVYQKWDEAAFAKILARPADPREKEELETYKQLHGACTGFEPSTIETGSLGTFTLTCERGTLAIELWIDGAGLIEGFYGRSRGVESPRTLARTVAAIVSLSTRWDDRLDAKLFAKSRVPAMQRKKQATTFRERHGDCKLARPIHRGFDWGYELACKKEDVELYIVTSPTDAAQITGIELRPVHGAPKRCVP